MCNRLSMQQLLVIVGMPINNSQYSSSLWRNSGLVRTASSSSLAIANAEVLTAVK